MDWTGLRLALASVREHRGIPDTQLARRAGINRQTVARIEDVARDPDYEPRLSTIEAWLLACDAGPVSAFLVPYEHTSENTSGAVPLIGAVRHTGDMSSLTPSHRENARGTQEPDLASVLARLADPGVVDALARAIATALAQSLGGRARPVATPRDAAGD